MTGSGLVTGRMPDVGSSSTGRRERPYQRRRRGPVAILVTVLAAAAVVTWTPVLTAAAGAGVASCPAPVGSPSPGETLEPDALDGVAPAPPAAVKVQVFNASGQRGQANLVAAQLGELGFKEAALPANDPFYPSSDMECTGQVRFGPAGESAANTLALVLPCTELVRDGRADDTVSVSVGTEFTDVNPSRAVKDALEELTEPSGGTDGSGNADPNADPDAPAGAPAPPPTVDPAVLAEARDASC